VTTQASDTVILCGHRFELTQLGYLPAAHPAVIDLSKPAQEGARRGLPKCSALHRGYIADWEIHENGGLYLTSLSYGYRLEGGPLHASWVSVQIGIPLGEVDETRSRVSGYEEVRDVELELDITEGVVARWRLVKESAKGIRWKSGFDWPQIVVALAARGIVPDFQPPRYKASPRFSAESLPALAVASADLLERAGRDEGDTGKVLALDDWKMLSRGWADPFPKLDFHDAVRTFRGHGPTLAAQNP
jgi:hypothetical protein